MHTRKISKPNMSVCPRCHRMFEAIPDCTIDVKFGKYGTGGPKAICAACAWHILMDWFGIMNEWI